MRHTSKILALSLAFIMTLMTLVPYQAGLGVSFANSDVAGKVTEESAEQPGENYTAGDVAAPDENGEVTDQDNNDSDEDKAASEAASTIGFEGKEFDVKIESDPAAGLPDDTELSVEEITGKDKKYTEYYEKAVAAVQSDAKGKKTRTVRFVRLYDFELASDGEIIEPDADVDVTIDYSKAINAGKAEAAEDPENVRIVHFTKNEKGEPEAEVLEKDAVGASVEESALAETSFIADSFSVYAVVYTVDFHYGDGKYDFSIEGESSIMLSEVIERLHIGGLTIFDVRDAKFSDPDLVKVEKVKGAADADNGTVPADDWKLTSLKPFNTDEALTLTLNDGSELVVNVTDASTVIVKEGESHWYTTNEINTMVPGTMTQPDIVRDSSIDSQLNSNPYKVGVNNDSEGKADSIWKKTSYDPDTNTVSIEMDYFRQIYTSKLDFIFVIDETGTMNKDVTVDVNGTSYKASRAFWAREIALRASKFIFDWNTEETGFNNRTYYISWGGSKYIKSGFKTSYEAASEWYQQNSRIVGGGTNHNTTATQIQPVINQSIDAGRVPVVIYLSDFGSAMNSFKVASQQMLSQADVYPVLIYANDRHSMDRRSKMNADPDHQKMMQDEDPTTLLPVFEEIIIQAITTIDPNTTVTDQLSPSLVNAANTGVTPVTSEEDAAAKNAAGSTEAFKNGGQPSYDADTGVVSWKMNNGTDDAGQINRMRTDANSVYTSTVSVPMKDDVVVSGAMPTNDGMQVKDSKGNVTNQITDNPTIGKGVKFVLGALDENGSKTSNVINNAGFTLTKTSGSGSGDGGTFTTDGSGSFTVPQTAAEFKPGDTFTLTQTSTNTDIAVMPDPATWTLTVNDDYTITATYSGTDTSLAMTAANGAFRIWNKSKASAFTPLVPVVVKKTWDGYSASNSDAVQFTVLGNDGNGGTIELPAYSTNDRTVTDFESYKVTELKKSDKSPEAGNDEWTKTVYVPAYSGTGSAKVVFYDTPTNQYTNGYTIQEDGMTVEEHPGTWDTDIDPSGKTAGKDITYYTYTGTGGWSKPIDVSTNAEQYYITLNFANHDYSPSVYQDDSNFVTEAKPHLVGTTNIVFEFTYMENGSRNKAVLTSTINSVNIDDILYVGGLRWPSSWTSINFTKITANEFVIHDTEAQKSYLSAWPSLTKSNLNYDDANHRRGTQSSTLVNWDPLVRHEHTASGLQYPILQISNTFTPLYELTISNSFIDATRKEHNTANGDDSDHTAEQVQSVTYSVLDGDGNEVKTVTLDKNWSDSWEEGQTLDCESKTLELPAGSYTVKQKYYTIADGRKISADADGKFAAYSVNNGSQRVTLGDLLSPNGNASFTNTRLTHTVIVKTVWEYPEDMTKTTTYNNGTADVTVNNEDIVIPFKIGTSIFRHHGVNKKDQTPAWEDDEDNIPSFGVDGYPIVCELDFDQLDKDENRDTREVLYTFYTEITQSPEVVSSTEDVTFTINIMRNRMPLEIRKSWINNENTDATGGNESVIVKLKNEQGQVVTPQYESDPEIEVSADGGWKHTVYVPGGFKYTVEETKIGDTSIGSQQTASRYVPTYTYTDKKDDVAETEAVWIESYDNERSADFDPDYVPRATVRNSHMSNVTVTLKEYSATNQASAPAIRGGKFSLYEGDLTDTQIASATAVWNGTSGNDGTVTIPGDKFLPGKTYTLKQTETDDDYALPGYTWKLASDNSGTMSVASPSDQMQDSAADKIRTRAMVKKADNSFEVYNETCNKLVIDNQTEGVYALTSVFGNNGVYLLNTDGTYAAVPGTVSAGGTITLAILSGAGKTCDLDGQFTAAVEGDEIKAASDGATESEWIITGDNDWKTYIAPGNANNVTASLGAAGTTATVTFTMDSYYTYLSVTKLLPGDFDDRTADYTFAVSGLPAGSHAAKVTNVETGATEDLTSDSFTLKHNQSIVLRVPSNKAISITETPVEGYGVSIDKSGVGSPSEATVVAADAKVTVTLKARYTATTPAAVVFENTLESPIVPSGLKIASGVLAFALIIVLAVMYVVTTRRRRRA